MCRSKASKARPLTDANKRFAHKISSIHARVEHVFRVIKRQFGYTRGCYKGIAKNAAPVFTATMVQDGVETEGAEPITIGSLKEPAT